MTGAEIGAITLGSVDGAVKTGDAISNWIWGKSDREYQRQINEQAQKNYEEAMNYQKQIDQQAQANFEAQMAFQQNQSDIQQQQFQANRIGNLTKEYKEAGLNPFLAAGMGASTASVIGVGGSANFKGAPSGANTHLTSQIKAGSGGIGGDEIARILQQGELNEANINLINAEAELAKTQAEDIKETRTGRVEELEKKIDKIAQDIAESKAREKNTNVVTEKVELENQMLSNKLVESNYRADCFRLLEDTQGKKLSKLQKRQIMSQLNAQTVENRFKTAMTVEQYVKSVCEVVQTATGVALDSKSIADFYSNASKIGFMAQ